MASPDGALPGDGTGAVVTEVADAPAPAATAVSGEPTPAEQPIWDLAMRVLGHQVGQVLQHEAGARSGEDPEDVHRMRVATRRMRALLRLVRPWFRPPRGGRASNLRALASALGAVRDLDVQIEALQRYAALAQGATRHTVEAWCHDLERQRQRARERLVAFLDSPTYDRLARAYAAEGAEPRQGRDQSPETPARAVVARVLVSALEELYAHPALDDPRATAAQLHDLRITGKQLRYCADLFSEVLPRGVGKRLAIMPRLQQALGAIHDADVLNGLLVERAQGATWAEGLAHLIAEDRARALASLQDVRRQLLEPEWRRGLYRAVYGKQAREAPLEIERKYRLDPSDATALRRRLRSAGLRSERIAHQVDHYLGERGPDTYLRLREERAHGRRRWLLTRKLASPDGLGRREVEERVSPFVAECLLSARWRPRAVELRKERQPWAAPQGNLSVALDSIHAAGEVGGLFLEIEALVPPGADPVGPVVALHDLCRALRLYPQQLEPRSNLERLLGAGGQR